MEIVNFADFQFVSFNSFFFNYQRKILNMIGFEHYSRIFKFQNILQSFKNENLKRDSLPELKLEFKKYVSKKITEIIQNKDFESIDLKTI